MKHHGVLAFFISIFVFSFSLVPALHAALVPAEVMKMTQGEFALALVKDAGAVGRLSPAASGQDAIDFLHSLGIVPEGGWDANAKVDEDFLRRLVAGSGGEASGSVEDLLQKVEGLVSNAVDNLPANQNVNPGGAGPS